MRQSNKRRVPDSAEKTVRDIRATRHCTIRPRISSGSSWKDFGGRKGSDAGSGSGW